MPQFHLYRNSNKETRKTYPYLLDIQSNLLSDLRTTVVVPLMPNRLAGDLAMSRLNPGMRIKGEAFTVMTQNLAGVDRRILGEAVGDYSRCRSDIFAAIDFMLLGI